MRPTPSADLRDALYLTLPEIDEVLEVIRQGASHPWIYLATVSGRADRPASGPRTPDAAHGHPGIPGIPGSRDGRTRGEGSTGIPGMDGA